MMPRPGAFDALRNGPRGAEDDRRRPSHRRHAAGRAASTDLL